MTAYQTRALQRRARTLELKGQALLCDLVDAFGPESVVTDFADNIVDAAQQLHEALEKCVRK